VFRVSNLSVSIARPPLVVYDYLAEPANLPHWTMVLGPRFRQIDARHWVAEEPLLETGPIVVGFMPRNRFGVVDYEFNYAGRTMTFPVRVVANGEGSEVVVSFFATKEASDERMASEVEWIHTDLLTLKTLLEG
jgi:hypothetical protein